MQTVKRRAIQFHVGIALATLCCEGAMTHSHADSQVYSRPSSSDGGIAVGLEANQRTPDFVPVAWQSKFSALPFSPPEASLSDHPRGSQAASERPTWDEDSDDDCMASLPAKPLCRIGVCVSLRSEAFEPDSFIHSKTRPPP